MGTPYLDVIARVVEEGIELVLYPRKYNYRPGEKVVLPFIEHNPVTKLWFYQMTKGLVPVTYHLVLNETMEYIMTYNKTQFNTAEAVEAYNLLQAFILSHV